MAEHGCLSTWERLTPVTSELTKVECLRTLERYRFGSPTLAEVLGDRRAATLQLLRAFELIEVSSAVLERAGDSYPVQVATLDAIHLATALILREEDPALAFATHDKKLAAAARSMGFTVDGA